MHCFVLAHKLLNNGVLILRYMIIVERFYFEIIKKTIREIIDAAERPGWEQAVQILCRYFAWEYEGHQTD